MTTWKPGDRASVGGKAGEVTGVSTYGELYPDNVRAAADARRPRATPIDPAAVIVAVRLDGEERARNYPVGQLSEAK